MLKLNTNVRALNNLTYSKLHNNQTQASIQRLSSGLKINSAFDDASGLSISNSLNSSAITLKQGIKNANEVLSMLNIADKAMDEQSKILDTIKTKATAAAQDGQSTKTRKMLLADINRLLEEYDLIANTTSYNSLSLLNGSFFDKVFQVGANANTTIKTSIQSTHSSKIGVTHFRTSANVAFGNFDEDINIKITNINTQQDYNISSRLDIKTRGLIGIAEDLNKIADKTGIRAFVQNQYIGINNIRSGHIDATFTINGVSIGNLQVVENDEDGALIASINAVKDSSGVSAYTDKGRLVLSSIDGRGITLGGMNDKLESMLNLPPSNAIVANTFPAGGIGANDLILNGVSIPLASNTKAQLVQNINALEEQIGVYAFLKDDNVHFVSKKLNEPIEFSGNASGNLGIEFRNVRGNEVAADIFIERLANQRHTFNMQYYDLNNRLVIVPLNMPPKPDGKYYLQDIVDAINASGSGFRASVEDLGNNRARLSLETPKNMDRFRGFATVSGPTISGDANTLGVTNAIFNNPKSATFTRSYENYGRITLSAHAGTSHIGIYQNDIKINGILGLGKDQTGFFEHNVSLKELVHINNEELNETLGVFASTDAFAKSLADKDTLSLRRAMALMDVSENALSDLGFIRAQIGSAQIQLNSTINHTTTNEINLKAAASQIKDLDFAQESANFTRNNILSQANTFGLQNILNLQEKLITSYLQNSGGNFSSYA